MKNIIFVAMFLLGTLISFSSCKHQEMLPEEPEYFEKEYYAKPFYHKTSISLTSDNNVNYNDAIIGSALTPNFNDLYCRFNSFTMTVPFTNNFPGKYYNRYPYIYKDFLITEIPLGVGKTRIVNQKYGSNINCKTDTFPRTIMRWGEVTPGELLGLTTYYLNPQDDNYVELTQFDTLVTHVVSGNIKLKFLENGPKGGEYPDTINLKATFKIDW